MSQPASFQTQDFPFDKLFAGHLPPVGFQRALEGLRGFFGRLPHVRHRLGHDLVQGFGLVLVETGALELVHVLADQGQLVGKYLKRILAHVRSAFAAT